MLIIILTIIMVESAIIVAGSHVGWIWWRFLQDREEGKD